MAGEKGPNAATNRFRRLSELASNAQQRYDPWIANFVQYAGYPAYCLNGSVKDVVLRVCQLWCPLRQARRTADLALTSIAFLRIGMVTIRGTLPPGIYMA